MLQLVSNGFFKKYKVSVDYHEEIQFNEIENEDTINVLCDDYNFNINDLRGLESRNMIYNILKDRIISEEDYNNFAVNYYVEYSRVKDEIKVVINIYDFDFINKDLEDFINKFERSIEIIVNLEEEKEIFKKQLDDYCKWLGYKGLEDFYNLEYDNCEE